VGFNEGIGYMPFAGIAWEAWQTIMKDKKDGAAARAAYRYATSKPSWQR
jgi:hypothetical protein